MGQQTHVQGRPTGAHATDGDTATSLAGYHSLEHAAAAYQQARLDPRLLSPSAVLALQRTIGNQGVNQLLRGGSGRALIPSLASVAGRPASSPGGPSALAVQRARGSIAPPKDVGINFPYTVTDLENYFNTYIQAQIQEVQNEADGQLRAAETYLRDTEIPHRQNLYNTALAGVNQALLNEAALPAGSPIPVRPLPRAEFDLQQTPVAQAFRALVIALMNYRNKLNTSYEENYQPLKDSTTKKETDTSSNLKDEMTLEYDDEHGKLHFIAKPTQKKTAWDLSKGTANALCENAIKQHMDTLLAGSADKGWTVWYITEDNGKDVGRYHKSGERNGLPTSQFSIQLQVSKEDKHISYHGYPDEKALKTGVGKGRNEVG